MAYEDNIYSRIITNELNSEELDALKSSGEYEEIKQILEVADDLSLPAMNKQIGFENLIKKKNEKQKRRGRSLFLYMSSVAAISLLIFGVLFLFNDSDLKVETSNRQFTSVNLPDGSVVSLNAGSKIEYPVEYVNENRRIKLDGEAFFNVEKGGSFIVSTIGGEVEVLGTSFLVYSRKDRFMVKCYTGSVQVKYNADTSILSQKEGVVIENGRLLSKLIVQEKEPLWQSGVSKFEDVKLPDVFDELSRQFDILITAPDISRRFSGTFRHDSIDTALDEVCIPMGLNYTKIGNSRVIISVRE